MKRILLTISFFVMIVAIGPVMVNNRNEYTSRHRNIDVADALLDSEAETFQKAEDSKEDYERRSAKLEYEADDLVYREYAWGNCLEKGCGILIEKDEITYEMGDAQNIVIILNDSVYKEFSFNNNDIEFTLEQSGNYVFLAIDSDGNSVDITSKVMVYQSANGGVILLN